jgi:hypothetical protein
MRMRNKTPRLPTADIHPQLRQCQKQTSIVMKHLQIQINRFEQEITESTE